METTCISESLHVGSCFGEVLGTTLERHWEPQQTLCEHEINSFGLNH